MDESTQSMTAEEILRRQKGMFNNCHFEPAKRPKKHTVKALRELAKAVAANAEAIQQIAISLRGGDHAALKILDEN